MFRNQTLKFILALALIFSLGYICSSDKDKKDDTKKEDTKKEDSRKEDSRKEDNKDSRKDDVRSDDRSSTSGGDAKVYFCEEYRDGREIGVSDVFVIGRSGGYFTCMIDMRHTGRKIGVGKVELRITKLGDSEKIIATEKFDVQPDWDYIYFDKFHVFYSPGDYKVTVLKPDGTPVGSGTVTIRMR
ncbi:MAG: hypothetical protein N2510_02555 [Ignavibacteria bacterium]|nr:hypothetical protein [Ignavibacteria bacterium]